MGLFDTIRLYFISRHRIYKEAYDAATAKFNTELSRTLEIMSSAYGKNLAVIKDAFKIDTKKEADSLLTKESELINKKTELDELSKSWNSRHDYLRSRIYELRDIIATRNSKIDKLIKLARDLSEQSKETEHLLNGIELYIKKINKEDKKLNN